MFQSPLGEVVKETITDVTDNGDGTVKFQSPLGEVVKETFSSDGSDGSQYYVSIPSRGSGKGDSSAREPYPERVSSLKSTHHFLPVNKTVKPAISSVACKP